MKGTLYGIGVGPGDPEDITIKAVRLLKLCPVIAIPHSDPSQCTAYQIAVSAVPEIKDKALLCIKVPMTKNRAESRNYYQEGCRKIMEILDRGQDVALITIGDSTIYASDLYMIQEIAQKGYGVQVVNGIPSFCLAAARHLISLGEREEQIHIIPASYDIENGLKLPGVKVLMKMGRSYPAVKEKLVREGYRVWMAENCGMSDEKIYCSADSMPEQAGYYSLLIVRDPE